MKYDITKPSSPKMPELGRGTECLILMLSQTSKDMHEPLVPMFFPILGSHITGVKFQYPDQSWKEPTGMMANLVAESVGNKGQLSRLPLPTRGNILCIVAKSADQRGGNIEHSLASLGVLCRHGLRPWHRS